MKSNGVFSRKILSSKQIFLPKLIPVLLLIICLFAAGEVCAQEISQEDILRVHFIDVGYGDATLIELPGQKNIMIDAGEHQYSTRVIDYLQSLDIRSIEAAVITHPHKNHFEGFYDILKFVPIKRIYINGDHNAEEGYEELLKEVHNRNIPTELLKRGNKINDLSPSVQIEVLHPDHLDSGPNNNSIVLLLKHKSISFLFMADVGLEVQEEILHSYRRINEVSSVKVPHHGGPVSEVFMEKFLGKVFIISTGPNKWGWPKKDDLDKLIGVVHRTDREGTIILKSTGDSLALDRRGMEEN